MNGARKIVQAATALLYNLDISRFMTGGLYTGKSKLLCVPGLNCYSCPAAVGACPMGSLASSLASGSIDAFSYVLGLLLLFGALFGRFICGYACPFGLVQELLYLIPVKKLKWKAGNAKYIKYAVLALLVVLIPLTTYFFAGMGVAAFCKYVCPAGTLAGVALISSTEGLAGGIGALFYVKLALLLLTVAASVLLFRPFCKVLCPLGAFYGICNRFALTRYALDETSCTGCGKCAAVCKMEVDPRKGCNSAECVRCGECVKACPARSIRVVTPFQRGKRK